MQKLSKRKYPALEVDGKWFTGWTGEIGDAVEAEHVTRKMRLQFLTTEKGMSSATAIFRDKEGFRYTVSFGGLELIIKLLHWPRSEWHQQYDIEEIRDRNGTWIEGTFMQVKKGQNYFIEPAEVEND